jgi:PAS domain S-box-containing protein
MTTCTDPNLRQYCDHIFQNAFEGMFFIDPEGHFLRVNPAFTALLGYTEEDLAGKNFTSIVHKEERVKKATRAIKLHHFQRAEQSPIEMSLVDKQGELVLIGLRSAMIRDASGTVTMAIGMIKPLEVNKPDAAPAVDGNFRDSMQRTIVDRGLQKAMEETRMTAEAAEQANSAKSEFLANISHEIRTPMNSIIGFADMLMDTKLSTEQRDFVETIQRSGEALLALSNDILDFSKIESAALEFESVAFDPEILCHDVCELLRPRIAGKPIEVLLRVGDTVPSKLIGDPYRFKQVLANLMSNAAKFTDKGEIELALTVESETDAEAMLHALVRDTGIGIPPDKLEIIFEAFMQADGSTTRRYGGTGLGLSICRKIARLFNGEAWAESTPGAGSTFHCTALMKKAPGRNAPRFSYESLENKKALVVDDNWHNIEIMQHMLEHAGMRVVTAGTAEEAFEAVSRSEETGDPFALGILDTQMPRISGYEIAQRIQEMPGGQFPLIASSSLSVRSIRKCQAAGFSGYMPKPIHRQKLLKMVELLLGKTKITAGDAPRETPTIMTQHSIREEVKNAVSILLAEDNIVNQKLATTLLTKAGYQVTVAQNGRQAVDIFTQSPESFDIIFMDVQLPKLSGIEATGEIRQRGFDKIPIVAMTAHALKDDGQKCIAAGMNDYIAKPIKREIIFEMVNKWVMERPSS